MDKKGYMKTIEVTIAFVLSFGFLMLLTVYSSPYESSDFDEGILYNFLTNDEFRNCVVYENQLCIIDMIESENLRFKSLYDYTFIFTEDPNTIIDVDVDSEIFVESLFISGDYENYDPKFVILYYWFGSEGFYNLSD